MPCFSIASANGLSPELRNVHLKGGSSALLEELTRTRGRLPDKTARTVPPRPRIRIIMSECASVPLRTARSLNGLSLMYHGIHGAVLYSLNRLTNHYSCPSGECGCVWSARKIPAEAGASSSRAIDWGASLTAKARHEERGRPCSTEWRWSDAYLNGYHCVDPPNSVKLGDELAPKHSHPQAPLASDHSRRRSGYRGASLF